MWEEEDIESLQLRPVLSFCFGLFLRSRFHKFSHGYFTSDSVCD